MVSHRNESKKNHYDNARYVNRSFKMASKIFAPDQNDFPWKRWERERKKNIPIDTFGAYKWRIYTYEKICKKDELWKNEQIESKYVIGVGEERGYNENHFISCLWLCLISLLFLWSIVSTGVHKHCHGMCYSAWICRKMCVLSLFFIAYNQRIWSFNFACLKGNHCQ